MPFRSRPRPDEIRDAVRRMFTDPGHLKASDPGRIEGNVVFTYLDAFDEDRQALEELKARYVRGGLGDSVVKKRLEDILQALLAPIRERRRALARDPGYVLEVIKRGTAQAREITDATLREVRAALGLFRTGLSGPQFDRYSHLTAYEPVRGLASERNSCIMLFFNVLAVH